MTNNDLQNTTQKTKDPGTRTRGAKKKSMKGQTTIYKTYI
jgi:hypothetical protein